MSVPPNELEMKEAFVKAHESVALPDGWIQVRADVYNELLAAASGPAGSLLEALARHEYRNGGCCCGKFTLPLYSIATLEVFNQANPGVDIRWRYWCEHLAASLGPGDRL